MGVEPRNSKGQLYIHCYAINDQAVMYRSPEVTEYRAGGDDAWTESGESWGMGREQGPGHTMSNVGETRLCGKPQWDAARIPRSDHQGTK